MSLQQWEYSLNPLNVLSLKVQNLTFTANKKSAEYSLEPEALLV